MPKNISTFIDTINARLANCASTLEDDFKQHYVANMLTTINFISTSFENEDLPEMLRAHIIYSNLNSILHARLIENFFKIMSSTELNSHLHKVFMQAILDSAPDLEQVDLVFSNYILTDLPFWQTKLFLLLAEDYVDLRTVFAELALYISNRFLGRVRILCGYDPYEKFYASLNEQLNLLIPYVEVETDVDSITTIVEQYIDPSYMACFGEHAFSIDPNPVVIFRTFMYDFYAMANEFFNEQKLNEIEADLLLPLIQHRIWLQRLDTNSSAQDVYSVIYKNLVTKFAMHKQLHAVALNKVENFFVAWVTSVRPELIYLADDIRLYKDDRIVRHAANNLYNKLIQKIDLYFCLPISISRPEVEAPPARPKSSLSM